MTTATAAHTLSEGAATTGLRLSAVATRAGIVGRMTAAYEQIASIVIAAVFLASGFLHLENPYYFLSSVYAYGITGPMLGEVIAIVLPIAQITAAVCLLGRVCVGGALLASAGMFGMFVAVQTVGLCRGLKIDCGCFGSGYTQSLGAGSLLLASTMLLLAISAYVAWRFARRADCGA